MNAIKYIISKHSDIEKERYPEKIEFIKSPIEDYEEKRKINRAIVDVVEMWRDLCNRYVDKQLDDFELQEFGDMSSYFSSKIQFHPTEKEYKMFVMSCCAKYGRKPTVFEEDVLFLNKKLNTMLTFR